MFDHYQWRGSELAQYSLYDYFKLITIVSDRNRVDDDIPFGSGHPQQQCGAQRP